MAIGRFLDWPCSTANRRVMENFDCDTAGDGGEGRTCMPSFTDILSRVPAVREDDLIVITSNKSATLPTAKSDKERLEDKIMEASAAGDKSSATLFFRLYEQLCSGTMLLKPPMNLADQRSVSSDASLLGQTTKASNSNPVFVSGALPGHMEIGFTPYFDKSLRFLKGIIPLTIFDKEWQEDCMNNHMLSNKKKVEEKNGEYVGYAYPNEWTQSFAKWTSNHRSFLITVRDVYKHKGFVPWLIAHKGNVDQIIADCGFLTGVRYNMIVRQNTFAFPVPQPDGSRLVPDISILRNDIKDKVYQLTGGLDELDYSNNPYTYNWDLKTSKPKAMKHKKFENANNGDNSDSGGGRGRGGYGGRGGWHGRNDDQGNDFGGRSGGWNGNDNGWGQKRKAGNFNWTEESGNYNQNQRYKNNYNDLYGLMLSGQGPSETNSKKDGGGKSNVNTKGPNMQVKFPGYFSLI
ncbi:hypothetical protein PSTT_15445 [Puccinia striiformis]|uniref:Uncharacterized protein n=4 Tax=Puccinia striiformis TaxID=27350 RepID=A0A2S4UHK0_9BASI|nr:hypothetical protein PSTT_15445 [Puccinia striiformis]